MCVLEITGWPAKALFVDDHRPNSAVDEHGIADMLSGNTDLEADVIDDVIEQIQRKGCVSIPLAVKYDEHTIASLKQALEFAGAEVVIRH
jgi:hypothetical protein